MKAIYSDGAVHNDNHKEINIEGNVTSDALNSVMKHFFDDAEEAVVLPSTPEEAMKAALVWLMEEKDMKGAYLFDKPNQWGVIYRVALDKKLCKDNVSAFGRWIDSLGIEGQRMKSPDKNLARCAIPVSFDTWLSNKGDDYDETKAEIGRRFRSKLENLLQ